MATRTRNANIADPVCDFEETLSNEEINEILKDFDNSNKVTDMSNQEEE